MGWFSPTTGASATASSGSSRRPFITAAGQNARVDLARLGWLGITLVCLIAVLILVLEGYYGYAGVTFAVALSAAINIT